MSEGEPFLGIDFGTSTSSMAWFNLKTGSAEMVRNAEGDDKTPSVVYFGARETLVGKHAEAMIDDRAECRRVVVSAKRNLARPTLRDVGGRMVTPLDAAVEILRKLKRDAEAGLFHQAVARAVITCPADFDIMERDKIAEAGGRAGFREVELLEEPVAAALAYAHAGLDVGRSVLVYDLGGGTFDLALLVRDDDGEFRLAMEPKGLRCGGDDFDLALYERFEHLLKRQENRPISTEGIDLPFLRGCRQRKEELSVRAEFEYRLPLPESSRPVVGTLKRDRFETLIEAKVEPTIRLTREMLEEARSAGHVVESVVLIGGSSRMPLVIRKLKEALPIEPKRWQHQDVAVALGAAHYANRLWGKPAIPSSGPPPAAQAPSRPASSKRPSAEAQDLHRLAVELLRQARNLGHADSEDARLAKQQPLAAALQNAQAACDLEPNWPDAFHLKGSIFQERDEWRLADAAHTACLRLAPDHPEAHGDRGLCKVMAGDFAGARQDLTDAIQLNPKETAFRRRAVACLRQGDATAALADVQAALAKADSETPVAALHTVAGFLSRDELHAPARAIPSFAQALIAMQIAIDQYQFSLQCAFLGVADRMIMDFPAGASTVKLVKPVHSVQFALWEACKRVHGGCTQAAVDVFHSNNTHPVDEFIHARDPDFALLSASRMARKKDAAGVIHWLRRMLQATPWFDIRIARRDPAVARLADDRIKEFFQPQWSFAEQHGALFNHMTVTNLSPFRITSVVVTAALLRGDWKNVPPIQLRAAAIDAGKSMRWDNAFPGGGLFGWNILQVIPSLTCAESDQTLALVDDQVELEVLQVEEVGSSNPDEKAGLDPLPGYVMEPCPKCGFAYCWDGMECWHCRHRSSR